MKSLINRWLDEYWRGHDWRYIVSDGHSYCDRCHARVSPGWPSATRWSMFE